MKEHYLKRELDDLIKRDSSIFNFIASGVLDGIWFWDLENPDNKWMSPKFWKLFGYEASEKEHLTNEWENMIYKDDIILALDNYRKHCEDPDHAYDQVMRYFHKDGSIMSVRCRGLAIRNKDGMPVRMLGALTDVTDLVETKKLYHEILNNLPVIVYTFSERSGGSFFSDSVKEVLGYDKNFLIENPFLWNQSIHDDYKVLVKDSIDGLKTNKGFDIEYKIKRADGQFIWLHDRSVSIQDYAGENIVVGVASDISERKLYERRLEKAKELAEHGNMIKSKFLANMSHEIRTPLNGIMGTLQMLEATELTKEQEEYLDISKQAIYLLKHVIDDILDYSKLEAEKVNFKSEIFDIRTFLSETKELFRPEFINKDLDFKMRIDKKIPKFLVGDPFRFRQIMINLIGNSIKFTNEGYISVNVKLMEKQDKNVWLEVSVKDTGIGIPAENLNNIFESFSQVDSRITKSCGGTGLGLAIVKKIIDQMGGLLNVDSSLGVGTELKCLLPFTFKDNISVKQLENIKTSHNTFNKEKTILIVEDDDVSRIMLGKYLAKAGYNVINARDGKEGIDRFKDANVDLILMDIHMPELNGHEATRILRRKYNTKTPIIAVSASAFREDIDDCLSIGMNDFIAKPVIMKDAFDKIQKWLSV